jgi:hypothetical protein
VFPRVALRRIATAAEGGVYSLRFPLAAGLRNDLRRCGFGLGPCHYLASLSGLIDVGTSLAIRADIVVGRRLGSYAKRSNFRARTIVVIADDPRTKAARGLAFVATADPPMTRLLLPFHASLLL